MRHISTALLIAVLFVVGSFGGSMAQSQEQSQQPNQPQQQYVSPQVEQMTSEFYMNIGDYYDVSYDEVADVLETGISDDDLAVAFFIGAKCESTPVQIAARRVAGETWYKIYSTEGLSSGSFWIPLKGKSDQRIFHRLVDLSRSKWNSRLALSDNEVTDLVNIGMLRTVHPKLRDQTSEFRAAGRHYSYILHLNIRTSAYEHKVELAQEEN